MIKYETNEMMLPGTDWMKIEKWEVWFMSPFGLHGTLEEAINRIKESDLNYELCIVPVAVAINGEYYEPVFRQ